MHTVWGLRLALVACMVFRPTEVNMAQYLSKFINFSVQPGVLYISLKPETPFWH